MRKIILLITVCISTNINAQHKIVSDTSVINSIDRILTEMLNIISGEKGETRDWNAFENLFLSTATFSTLSSDKSYSISMKSVNLDGFY
jgi:hypothetical protein